MTEIYDDSWNLNGIIIKNDNKEIQIELSGASDRKKTIEELKEFLK